MTSLLSGLGAGFGLIVAIGAQNAFVLRQGLSRRWVLPVVLVCLVSDALLILAGVAGIGVLVEKAPLFLEVVRWGGVVFLLAYGALAARRALRPSALTAGAELGGRSAKNAVLTALGLTWLNPHVYLDTLILLGSLAAAQGDPGRWAFGAGAVLASAVWFPLIGFGARALQGFFARPAAWRVLDGLVALMMLSLALSLILKS